MEKRTSVPFKGRAHPGILVRFIKKKIKINRKHFARIVLFEKIVHWLFFYYAFHIQGFFPKNRDMSCFIDIVLQFPLSSLFFMQLYQTFTEFNIFI